LAGDPRRCASFAPVRSILAWAGSENYPEE
jgi:hypothetical protein